MGITCCIPWETGEDTGKDGCFRCDGVGFGLGGEVGVKQGYTTSEFSYEHASCQLTRPPSQRKVALLEGLPYLINDQPELTSTKLNQQAARNPVWFVKSLTRSSPHTPCPDTSTLPGQHDY